MTKHTISEGCNPADAINWVLLREDLTWDNVVVDKKLRNGVGHAIIRDIR